MKKIVALSLMIFMCAMVFAQSTSPRFGTTSNRDNTGRVITYKYTAVTDAAGNDTIAVAVKQYETVYRLTLTDSCVLNFTPLTNCYVGDKVYIVASGASGRKFKFHTTNTLTAGTATTSTNTRACVTLIFDGEKFVELSRVVQ